MQTFARKAKATRQFPSAKTSITGWASSRQDPDVKAIFHLPRPLGNQTAGRAGYDFSRIPLSPPAAPAIQTKLAVGRPGDACEQEADRVSNQVMSAPEPKLQRACACGGECPACKVRQPGMEHESLQTKRVQAGDAEPLSAPPIIHDVLRSPGHPLDETTRGFMEPRFGHDFGRVRVHADAEAANAARAVQARAFTFGGDIVFGAGEYAPGTAEGRRLLAHELTHTVQQRGAVASVAGSLPQVIARGAPGWTVQRDKGKDKAKAPPPWTAAELKKMLDACDGGLGIWAKAKKANKDKDPVVKAGKTDTGGVTSGGTITLEETSDKCTAVQVLIQELSNMSRAKDFEKLSSDARAGNLARIDFIKGYEKVEYETGVKNVLTAFDACKDTWKCKTAEKEWARKAKDFDDYFKNFLVDSHKEDYGKWWDDNCKAAYEKKHAKKK